MMAVSKRTRFEVLRRDDFTCRYCRSRDNELTIDHVLPVALGGSDRPENLVAACRDCNTGKASTAPDSPLVADIDQDELRWAAARHVAAAKLAAHRDRWAKERKQFIEDWALWDKSHEYLPLDWPEAIDGWLDAGITLRQIIDAENIAIETRHIRSGNVFRYMGGIIRNWIIELNEATRAVLNEGGASDG